MKLRKDSTEIEDYLANKAVVIPDMMLINVLAQKLGGTDMLMPGNALSIIRNTLEPEY